MVCNTRCSAFARQIFFVEANTGVYGNSVSDGPGVLDEESVVEAGRLPKRAEVLYRHVTELPATASVNCCQSITSGRTIWTGGRISSGGVSTGIPYVEKSRRFIPALC